MKKTLALILAMALCLSLAACSGLTNSPADTPLGGPRRQRRPCRQRSPGQRKLRRGLHPLRRCAGRG
ncbi:MAG: hypothetical protein ACLTSG_00860 [Lachnospiraceae bacterium]